MTYNVFSGTLNPTQCSMFNVHNNASYIICVCMHAYMSVCKDETLQWVDDNIPSSAGIDVYVYVYILAACLMYC